MNVTLMAFGQAAIRAKMKLGSRFYGHSENGSSPSPNWNVIEFTLESEKFWVFNSLMNSKWTFDYLSNL